MRIFQKKKKNGFGRTGMARYEKRMPEVQPNMVEHLGHLLELRVPTYHHRPGVATDADLPSKRNSWRDLDESGDPQTEK